VLGRAGAADTGFRMKMMHKALAADPYSGGDP